MLDEQMSIIKKQGADALVLKGVSDVPDGMKKMAFVLAVDFVLSDGTVEREEEAQMVKLQTRLGISDETAANIISVLAAKYGLN